MGDKIDGDVFQWVVGGLLGIITSVGSVWINRINSRIDSLSRDLYERNQRVAVLESHIDQFNRRFDRIEGKLDLLLDSFSKK